jgi:UrcA family protein
MKLSTLVVASALALSGWAARADDAAAPNTATVRYADLDLNNPRGAAVLYQRLRRAAEHVCRNLDGRSLEFREGYAACVHQALAKALTDVDRTTVTAYAALQGIATEKASSTTDRPQ